MIAPPNALTTAGQKNPFAFPHIRRLSRTDQSIETMEDEDGELAAPFEAFRTENFSELTKWPKRLEKMEPHDVLKHYEDGTWKGPSKSVRIMEGAEEIV